jgi:hypothetical protein
MQAESIKYKNPDSFLKKCVGTFLSIGKVLLLSKPGVKLPTATAKSCVVLGNGPSLKQSLTEHSEFIRSHDILCVNSFAISDEYKVLKPKYCVMLDPGLWLSTSDVSKKTFNALIEKTDWDLTLFIPRTASKNAIFAEVAKANKMINIVFYNYTVYNGFNFLRNWLFKNNLAMPQCQNVLSASLFQCINMKYKEVFLFGADHTWHQDLYVNDDNLVCIKDVHFYENREKVNIRPFYKGMHLKETFKMHEIFLTWSKVFIGYFIMNDYARYMGCEIYNATNVSFIDAFKRIKL